MKKQYRRYSLGILFVFSMSLSADMLDYYMGAILPAIATQTSVGSSSLRVKVMKHPDGIAMDTITVSGDNILTQQEVDLLALRVRNIDTGDDDTIGALHGWGSVEVHTYNGVMTIVLASPQSDMLPSTLQVSMSVAVAGTASQWDIAVSGLGEHHSLMEVTYPVLNLQSTSEDTFFVPYYHGKLIEDTPNNPVDYTTRYPRGWGGTMQYMAYYNHRYGLYFGMHDPKASIKTFGAQSSGEGIDVWQNTAIANKSRADNNWKLPGYVALDAFEGDWYDAALKYRSWVFSTAEYRPLNTPPRAARQEKLGNVAIWVQEAVVAYDVDVLEEHIRNFKEYMDIPVGVAWTSFNGKEFDKCYPEIFPEKAGLKEVISRLKQSYGSGVYFSGYMNGMLYDMNLSSYASHEAYTIKNSTGEVLSQVFSGTLFAYMCPTQEPWHNIMSQSTQQMTHDIGFDGAYVDMVTASSSRECYDPSHQHPLGGGSYWRDGYKQMFAQMHEASVAGAPYVSEEANDFLIDEVDGFLTIGYSTNNQVPALSAVYAGHVQLVGLPMGWSDYKGSDDPDSQRFYGRVAQSFNYGVQLGRFWMGLVSSTHERSRRAADFVRELGRLRTALTDFFSFGRMLKPLPLAGSIPNVSFAPYTYPAIYQETVVLPAVQTSVWTNQEENAVALVFVNGKVPQREDDNITFSFDFNGALYGMDGDHVMMKEVTQSGSTDSEMISSVFTKTVTLPSYGVKVFVITP